MSDAAVAVLVSVVTTLLVRALLAWLSYRHSSRPLVTRVTDADVRDLLRQVYRRAT